MPKPIKKTDREKPWAKKKISNSPYPIEAREKDKVFLIICEGQNTEPWYFKSFPVVTAEVKSYGLGASKSALVDYVIKTMEKEEKDPDREVWVVFDMDVTPEREGPQKEDFNKAIEKAIRNDFKVAYSNDAFELWFLLHFQNLEVKWRRNEYYAALSKHLECNYEKEGKAEHFCRRIYEKLKNHPEADQNAALRPAETLHGKQENLPFADQNPCTTVYLLVKELNKYIR